ncbi:hypothetical protein OUZ56_021697 [Daphnia magna]|uniref:Uncharacterized protein n=1 Tax=Daphnia magna TaxID=35525 RepID=A0ABR0AU96_9CRUS|nr:hypothetical protein OUZ56_021697 [Daphnia magna]
MSSGGAAFSTLHQLNADSPCTPTPSSDNRTPRLGIGTVPTKQLEEKRSKMHVFELFELKNASLYLKVVTLKSFTDKFMICACATRGTGINFKCSDFFLYTRKQQTVVRTFVRKRQLELRSKSGRAHGTQYEAIFLMQALMLRMKSGKAYRHIQADGLLPLPCANTLRRLLNSSDCQIGFNELALENIRKALYGKK